jgi:raffinose/stachyose/melibiose transport system substrate-binding protein
MGERLRWALALAMITVLGAVAAACGGGSETTTSADTGATAAETASGEPVKLVMWWWGDQEAAGLQAYLDESVQLYQEQNPNITIETVLQSTDDLIPAFQAAAQAGEGPDIQYFWGGIWTMEPYWAGHITPIEDLLGEEEVANFVNGSEVTADGKVITAGWYVQPSFPMLVRTDVLADNGIDTPPATWDELMSACETLSANGVTPIAGGIKDGWFGGWLYSILGSQTATADDVKAAVLGQQSFTDPNQSEWWSKLQESIDKGCWNDDVTSVDLYQGQALWSAGKAAMTITAGTDVRKFVNEVGPDKVDVMAMPPYGDGPGAGKLGSTSQTLGVTSFSKHPQEAADFIKFLHTPERLQAMYVASGAFPADKRFDPSVITEPQMQKLWEMASNGSPYLENFIPSELDAKSVFAQSQLMFGGETDPAKAAEDMQSNMERLRTTNPDLAENYQRWTGQ